MRIGMKIGKLIIRSLFLVFGTAALLSSADSAKSSGKEKRVKADKIVTGKTIKSKKNQQADAEKIEKIPVVKIEEGLPKDAYLIDKIEAAVFGQEGTQVITKSDIERPSLDGKPRALEDLILERLMFIDAQRYKIIPDEDVIDKHLAAVQRENNLTLDDLKTIFAHSGYSYEEGRQQFGMMSVINSLLDFKIRSRLVVPEKDVVSYYNEHPEMQETAYELQRAVIPYAMDKSRQAQKQEILQFLHEGKGLVNLVWQEPLWVNKSDLSESKSFIKELKVGQNADPLVGDEGFEVFKLIEIKEEHLRSLEERYREIVDVLRRPKYESLLNDYKKQLYENASIVYFN